MYEVEDAFSVSGISLQPPKGKQTCLFLAKGLAEILSQNPSSQKKGPEAALKKEYNCPGCTGIIKFAHVDDRASQYLTPQMRMIAAAEKKEQAHVSSSLVQVLSTFSFFSILDDDHLYQ